MTDQERIEQLEQEIQNLKYALITVYTECSNETPNLLQNRLRIMKEIFIKNGINVNEIISRV